MNSNQKDLGIIKIQTLNDNESNDLLLLAQKYYDNNPYNQVCIFSSICEATPVSVMPILHLKHAKFFNGCALVVDFKSLELCISFPNFNKILFFASSLPWVDRLKHYKYWEKLLMDPKVNIIAQNNKIYDIYNICYKQPVCISERLDYEAVQKLI